jgi:cell division protein ZapA
VRIKGVVMTNNKFCKVKLLNKTYEIKCPEGEEVNLLLAADQINEKMQLNKTKFRSLDNFQCLLLAALDLSNQLIICKNEQEQQRLQVTQFITTLESKINKTLVGETDLLFQTD